MPSGGMGTTRGRDTRAHLFPRPSPRESCGTRTKKDVLEMLTFTKVRGNGVFWGAPALPSPVGTPEVLACSGTP